jgi:hypothetical protein
MTPSRTRWPVTSDVGHAFRHAFRHAMAAYSNQEADLLGAAETFLDAGGSKSFLASQCIW